MTMLQRFLMYWKKKSQDDYNLQDAFELVSILGICFFLKIQMPKIIITSKGQMLTSATNSSPIQNHPFANANFTLSKKSGSFSPAAFAEGLSTWKKVKLMVLIADS